MAEWELRAEAQRKSRQTSVYQQEEQAAPIKPKQKLPIPTMWEFLASEGVGNGEPE